jgi:hypothetical protein
MVCDFLCQDVAERGNEASGDAFCRDSTKRKSNVRKSDEIRMNDKSDPRTYG